jgi:pimeloyl-ACP methyl ester carboxylesterase
MTATLTSHPVMLHGHRVGVRIAGRGPVVVLVHGMTSSSATWTRAGRLLADRFTVVAPDLLGHGATVNGGGDYSLGAQATLVRDLLVALGHERATVVGHSYGGGVAMQFAYQYPERSERLVLVGSGGLGLEVNLLLRLLTVAGAELVLPIFCRPAFAEMASTLARLASAVGLRPTAAAEEIWRGYASLSGAGSRAAFFRTLRAVIGFDGQQVSAVNRLQFAANVPTMIVWGARDGIIPVDHARRAHAAIPGSRLELFEQVGHFPHCEAPERFARAIADFVDTTEPARVSAELLRAQAEAATG